MSIHQIDPSLKLVPFIGEESIKTICNLPVEKIYEIFSFLNEVDLRVRTIIVCKQWSVISIDYLMKADKEKCLRIQESAKLLSQKIEWILNPQEEDEIEEENEVEEDNEIEEDEDSEEVNLLKRKETLSAKYLALSAIADTTIEDLCKIKCFKLRQQVIDHLIVLNLEDLEKLQAMVMQSDHAMDLTNLALDHLDFCHWNNCVLPVRVRDFIL